MHDAATSMHHLHISNLGYTMVAGGIPVGNCPLPDVGNDLHIVMRVGAKTHFGSDFVVIPDENPAKAHARRVMIARETEVVMGIQPFILNDGQD